MSPRMTWATEQVQDQPVLYETLSEKKKINNQ